LRAWQPGRLQEAEGSRTPSVKRGDGIVPAAHASRCRQPRDWKRRCCAAGVTKRQKTDIALAAAVRSLLPASSSATANSAAAAAAASSGRQQAAGAQMLPQRQQPGKQPSMPPQQQQRPPAKAAAGPRLLEPRQHGAPQAPQQFYAVTAPQLNPRRHAESRPWCSCSGTPHDIWRRRGARRARGSGGGGCVQPGAGFTL
jgi:hypothetical protein